MSDVREEFEFFRLHQDEFVKRYPGKYIVLKGKRVLGAYDSPVEAYTETVKDHAPGTFLIQLCVPGEDAYSRTFYSRVAI